MRSTDDRSLPIQPSAPLDSLVLVIPLLVLYECGIIGLGPAAMRNGADAWLRLGLDRIGFGQYFLLPLLTCGLLLGYHHVGLYSWRVRRDAIARMALESVAFAFGLLVVSLTIGNMAVACELSLCPTDVGHSAQLVSYLGAGVYEELVFRLMMIPAIAWGLQTLGESKNGSWLTSALVSSFLFAAAHYSCLTGVGDALTLPTFCFRFIAGLGFSSLFVFRGFGTAVFTHALYDLALYLIAPLVA